MLAKNFRSTAPEVATHTTNPESLLRRDERAYWNTSASEEQRSQGDDRQADEANALFKQALNPSRWEPDPGQ